MYNFKRGLMLDGSAEDKIIEFTGLEGNGQVLKVQASYSAGTLAYVIQAKMSEEMEYTTIFGVGLGTTTVVKSDETISTKEIFEYDITGYEAVRVYTESTIDASAKIYACILSD